MTTTGKIESKGTKKKGRVLTNKGIANRQLFLKLFLSEEVDGKKNPYFGKAAQAAKAAGYSPAYARNILSRLAYQQNGEGERLRKVAKSMRETLTEKNLNPDWLANLIKRLGEKNDKRALNKRLVDTGDPDSFAAKVALDFVAKVMGLYEPSKDPDDLAGKSKEELIEIITR